MSAAPNLSAASLKKRSLALLGLFVFLTFAGRAVAEPITFYFDGVGTGTLGGAAFSSVTFEIAATADTANVVEGHNPTYISDWTVVPTISTISVTGLGTATFTEPMDPNPFNNFPIYIIQTVNNGFGQRLSDDVWFEQDGLEVLLKTSDPNIFGYQLNSSIAPIAGSAAVGGFTTGFQTSLGDLSFSSISDFTFSASAVPEPSSMWGLFGFGFAAILFFKHRRIETPNQATL